jgi:hypothetical protein
MPAAGWYILRARLLGWARVARLQNNARSWPYEGWPVRNDAKDVVAISFGSLGCNWWALERFCVGCLLVAASYM